MPEPLGPPETWTKLSDLRMSNDDHRIDLGLDAALRRGGVWAEYTAWHFFGEVWFDGTWFHVRIWQHSVPIATLTADSLDLLMDLACECYGRA